MSAALLKRCLDYLVDQQRAGVSYGSFYGGDPRDFHPDPECSTDEERAAHEKDCAAWVAWDAAGSIGDPPAASVRYGHGPLPEGMKGEGHVTYAGYGLGTTTWHDEDLDALVEALHAEFPGVPADD